MWFGGWLCQPPAVFAPAVTATPLRRFLLPLLAYNRKCMRGYVTSIEKATLENESFRKVLYTGPHCQLVLMCLGPGQEIGLETHADNDQFFRFESGQGQVTIDGVQHQVGDGSAVLVPAGAKHNVANASATQPLKLYTIYAPAHHRNGIVRATKAEAEANEAEFDGVTSE